MKKKIAAIIGGVIITMGGSTYAAMEHDHSAHDHGSQSMEHQSEMKMPDGMEMHTMEIDGHKINFHIMNRKAFRKYMDNMGHKTHKMKEGMTHYVMMDITDKEGKKIKRAKVKLKVIGPDKKSEEKAAFPMMGNFGAEFHMMDKGKYQVMTLFKIKKAKHYGGFWHEMK
ncbi:MAG: hypothetical protein OEV42_12395 [Deltaproteobacteria bacterium]|nr:hypothetical protein [Deltaproteobacteria bacterium]